MAALTTPVEAFRRPVRVPTVSPEKVAAVFAAERVVMPWFMVRVPVAPDTAEPRLMFVTEPETPAVPMFTVFVVAVSVAPVPRPYVEVAVDDPTVTVAAENVVVPEKVWVSVPIVASEPVRLGSV